MNCPTIGTIYDWIIPRAPKTGSWLRKGKIQLAWCLADRKPNFCEKNWLCSIQRIPGETIFQKQRFPLRLIFQDRSMPKWKEKKVRENVRSSALPNVIILKGSWLDWRKGYNTISQEFLQSPIAESGSLTNGLSCEISPPTVIECPKNRKRCRKIPIRKTLEELFCIAWCPKSFIRIATPGMISQTMLRKDHLGGILINPYLRLLARKWYNSQRVKHCCPRINITIHISG